MSAKSRKDLKPEQLSPAEEAAVQHATFTGLFTYNILEIITEIDPRLWGWKKKNELFEPVVTHKISFLGRLIAS